MLFFQGDLCSCKTVVQIFRVYIQGTLPLPKLLALEDAQYVLRFSNSNEKNWHVLRLFSLMF